MKSLFYLFLLSWLSLSYSCCELTGDCPPEPPDIDTTKKQDSLPYDIVWQTPLHPDTLFSVTTYVQPKIYMDKVIFDRRVRRSGSQEILAFNRHTGKLGWTWNDYFRKGRGLRAPPEYLEGKMFFTSSRGIFAIDLSKGTSLYRYELPDDYIGQVEVSAFNSKIFHSILHYDTLSILRMHDYITGDIREVFRVKKQKDKFKPDIYPPGCWLNQNDDTVLVFQSREYRPGPYGERSILYSYNLTRDSLMWTDTIAGVSSITQPPYIEEDRVYFLMSDSMLCINKHTGKHIWVARHDHRGGFLISRFVVTEDMIYMHSTVGHLVGIEKATGRKRFARDIGAAGDDLAYHDGRIYLTDGYLTIVNAKNGKTLYNLKSHNYSKRTPGSFVNGVAIDGEKGVMYVSDGFYAMCLTLPK